MEQARLKLLRRVEELGLDLANLSREMGRNHAYLQQFATRGVPRRLSEKDRAFLADRLGLPESDLLPSDEAIEFNRLGKSTPKVMVSYSKEDADSDSLIRNIRNRVAHASLLEYDVTPQAGGGSSMPILDSDGNHFVVAEWKIPSDFLQAFVHRTSDLKIVRVAGDSMEPDFPAGDRVLVDVSHRVPSPPGVYVLWDGYGLVLKRLELIIGGSKMVRISSINPAYAPYERALDEIEVNGRVVGKWTWR